MGGHGFLASMRPDYIYFAKALSRKFCAEKGVSLPLYFKEVLPFVKSQPSLPNGFSEERLAAMVVQSSEYVSDQDWVE